MMESNLNSNAASQGKSILVVGSGLAAYGTCLAFIEKGISNIFVIDIGLEAPYQNQPNRIVPNAIRRQGGFFPFGLNDDRWNFRVKSERICSSHAIGGYSKVYSGSILAPRAEDLSDWPEQSRPSASDYQAVLSTLRLWQVYDELSVGFPLDCDGLERRIRENVLLGAPRIALGRDFNKDEPFDCSHEFTKWSLDGRINYSNGRFVTHFTNIGSKVAVNVANNLGTEVLLFDQVFVGAGCINTTAIIDRSLYGEGQREYTIKSTRLLLQLYFKIWGRAFPFHAEGMPSPQNSDLCKVFIEHRSKHTQRTWSHTQVNGFNRTIQESIDHKLPPFARNILHAFHTFIFFSITSFHCRLGPTIMMTSKVLKAKSDNTIQELIIEEKETCCDRKLVSSLQRAVLSKFSILGLLPLPLGQWIGDLMRGNRLGGWHYGCTLPMMKEPIQPSQCQTTGEVNGLKNVFVIDAAGFPSVPASTVALLTMANAYRIAKISIKSSIRQAPSI